MAPQGVNRDHAAQGGNRARRWIDAEDQSLALEGSVEIGQGDSRLNANGSSLAIDAEEASHESREIEDDAGPQRLPCQAGTSPAGAQGDGIFGSIADALGNILGMARTDDRNRWNLIETGIAGVQLGIEWIAIDFAIEYAPQVRFDPGLFVIHWQS
jgi:hypothetical protein